MKLNVCRFHGGCDILVYSYVFRFIYNNFPFHQIFGVQHMVCARFSVVGCLLCILYNGTFIVRICIDYKLTLVLLRLRKQLCPFIPHGQYRYHMDPISFTISIHINQTPPCSYNFLFFVLFSYSKEGERNPINTCTSNIWLELVRVLSISFIFQGGGGCGVSRFNTTNANNKIKVLLTYRFSEHRFQTSKKKTYVSLLQRQRIERESVIYLQVRSFLFILKNVHHTASYYAD